MQLAANKLLVTSDHRDADRNIMQILIDAFTRFWLEGAKPDATIEVKVNGVVYLVRQTGLN